MGENEGSEEGKSEGMGEGMGEAGVRGRRRGRAGEDGWRSGCGRCRDADRGVGVGGQACGRACGVPWSVRAKLSASKNGSCKAGRER